VCVRLNRQELALLLGGIDLKETRQRKWYRSFGSEVELLIGDASKAKRKMGWEPKTKFKDLIELMVDADLKLLQDQLAGRIRPH
jgi:GDPmannose 4,6-dehydratase